MNWRGPTDEFVDENCGDPYGRCRKDPRWVLRRRDGLLACEKSEGKMPLGIPGDGVTWLKPGDIDVDDVLGLHEAVLLAIRPRVTELDDGGLSEA